MSYLDRVGIYYDKDIDYAEIIFKKVSSYGEDISPGIVVFKSEESDEIVGYAFAKASTEVFEYKEIPTKWKVAFLLKATRERTGYTQEQVIKKLFHVSGRQYQRAEAGENISLDVLDEIRAVLPEADFSKLLISKWACHSMVGTMVLGITDVVRQKKESHIKISLTKSGLIKGMLLLI